MLRRSVSFLGCAVLAVFAVACITPPRPDTRDADVAAVRDAEIAWSKDAASKDADKFVAYYADDVSLLLPNMPAINGKEPARAQFKAMFGDPNFSLKFQTVRAEASTGGDFVFTQGTYTSTRSDPKDAKKTISDKGKYLTVWRKQADGSWKAVADMINSDLP